MNRTIIKASAGTGKTYRLSLEYIYYLLIGIDFRNILVMTFTKKATYEIKSRILEFLNKIVTNDENKKTLIESIESNFNYKFKENDIDKLKKIYDDMIISKNNIRIDTIDGFTSKIFKTCISEQILRIYNYEIIDYESKEYDDFIRELIVRISNDKTIDIEYSNYDFENIKKEFDIKYIKNKYELSQYNKIETKYKIEDIINKVKDIFLVKYYEADEKKKDTLEIINYLEKHEIYNIEKYYKGLKEYLKKIKSPDNIFKKKSKYLKNNTLEIYKDIIDIYEIYTEYENSNLTNNIVKNYNKIKKHEEDIKLERKILEFNDLTYYTIENLYNEKLNFITNGKVNDDFYEILGGGIDAIMIDEFQDTSIAQYKLIEFFFNRAKYITIVGDEKQSIYGWRGGYKKLFENLEKILDNSKVLTLTTSYRSEREIIEFVNDKFSNISNYKYSRVNAIKNDNKGYIKVKNVNDKDDILINIVEDIKANKDYYDTAILLRNNKELNMISKLLERENIPYSLNDKNKILSVEAVKNVNFLIEYLVTKDETKKYSFLRSKACSFTLEKIQKLLNGEIELDKNIKKFIEKYQSSTSINSNIFDFAEEYLKIFSYSSNENLNEILNLREYFKIMKNYTNLEDFYKNIILSSKKKKSVLVDNSIILTTIHSSKGLEYKNVYTINTGVIRKQNDTIKKYVKYDENFNVIDFKIVYFTPIDGILNSINKIESEIEKQILLEYIKEKGYRFYDIYNHISNDEKDANINLDYVAFTRAKENCYIYYFKEDEIIKNEFEQGIRNFENRYIKDFNHFEIKDYRKISKYFSTSKYLIDKNEKTNIERIYKQKIGLALHYFFEVYRDNFDIAIDIVRKKYSNLLSDIDFDYVKKTAKENLIKYNKIINSSLNKYHELKIYDENDVYIIDLLLLDNDNKKAYIYDFKTGKDVKKNEKYIKQLENYKNILSRTLIDYDIYIEILPLEE